MHYIETKRLRLVPLNTEQLELLAKGRNRLESHMGLTASSFSVSAGKSFMDEMEIALRDYILPNVQNNPVHACWFTHWLVVHRADNLGIGGMGAAGPPDENGEVMIGYYVDEKYENRGFATEAVSAFTDWIFSHGEARAVIADTLATGLASQQVLQKNGFMRAGETDEGLRWRRIRS